MLWNHNNGNFCLPNTLAVEYSCSVCHSMNIHQLPQGTGLLVLPYSRNIQFTVLDVYGFLHPKCAGNRFIETGWIQVSQGVTWWVA